MQEDWVTSLTSSKDLALATVTVNSVGPIYANFRLSSLTLSTCGPNLPPITTVFGSMRISWNPSSAASYSAKAP